MQRLHLPVTLHVLFRRENFKLNLRPKRIPAPQMLSLRTITDNVLLIRRVEILANVQKACHLRLRSIVGASSVHNESRSGGRLPAFSLKTPGRWRVPGSVAQTEWDGKFGIIPLALMRKKREVWWLVRCRGGKGFGVRHPGLSVMFQW